MSFETPRSTVPSARSTEAGDDRFYTPRLTSQSSNGSAGDFDWSTARSTRSDGEFITPRDNLLQDLSYTVERTYPSSKSSTQRRSSDSAYKEGPTSRWDDLICATRSNLNKISHMWVFLGLVELTTRLIYRAWILRKMRSSRYSAVQDMIDERKLKDIWIEGYQLIYGMNMGTRCWLQLVKTITNAWPSYYWGEARTSTRGTIEEIHPYIIAFNVSILILCRSHILVYVSWFTMCMQMDMEIRWESIWYQRFTMNIKFSLILALCD